MPEHASATLHARRLDEEPCTPVWLTVLGVVLFVGVGLLFVMTRPSPRTTEELRAQQSLAKPVVDAPAEVPVERRAAEANEAAGSGGR